MNLIRYLKLVFLFKDEVKQVIDKVCRKLPSSIENDCNQFIDAYGDAVVAILAQEIDPSLVIKNCLFIYYDYNWFQCADSHLIFKL